MVNGIFLSTATWENFADQTWSMNGYCRPAETPLLVQHIETIKLSALARLSLFTSRAAAWESRTHVDAMGPVGGRLPFRFRGARRWTTRFSSDYRGRLRSSVSST